MVKFQAFYTILLLTVLVAVVNCLDQPILPMMGCDLVDPYTGIYSPNAECRQLCAFDKKRPKCDEYRCYCKGG